MAALDDELDDAIGELVEFAGETVTIRGNTPGLVFEGNAVVTDGAGEFESVAGGYYDKTTFVLTVSKADLTTFTPEPGNLVEVRGEEMRIPESGVRSARRHYTISLASRSTPR